MGSNSCFSEIIADVFPPWHRVNTHLDAAEQQTDRTSVSIELLTLTDDQLISVLRPYMLYTHFHCLANLKQQSLNLISK